MAFNRWEAQYTYSGTSYNSEGYGYYHNKKKTKKNYYSNSKEFSSYGRDSKPYSNWHYKNKYSGFGAYQENYTYSDSNAAKESLRTSTDSISQTSSKSTDQSQKAESGFKNSDSCLKTDENKANIKEDQKSTENPYQIVQSKIQRSSSRRTDSFDYTYNKTNYRKESITSDISSNTQNTEWDVESVQNKKENIPVHQKDYSSESTECRKHEEPTQLKPSQIIKSNSTNSEWRQGKFHNCSIFWIKNWSTWRLKIRKTQNPFNNINKKFEQVDKEIYCKTYILSKKVAIRSQEVNLDFMQDLQDADNLCSIDSPIELDTGFDKEKYNLSQIEGIDLSNTENSSVVLEALLPIQNENRSSEFLHLNNNHDKRDNLIWVEFEIDQNQEDLEFLRALNQTMVESHIQFKLNGRVHTK